jgi:hypothetical protein
MNMKWHAALLMAVMLAVSGCHGPAAQPVETAPPSAFTE